MLTRHVTFLSTCLLVVSAGGGGSPYLQGPQAVGGFAGAGGQISPYGATGAEPDFNPILLQGTRGYPGIRARLNMRAFQYAQSMVSDLLNSEIKKARIPPISQCVPQVNGCIQVYNLYVSRYRCPQQVLLYPAPPNRLVVQVVNVDVGVTGNLGGQIVILLPIALFGIVQLNLHQVTIAVDLAIERGPSGPYVRMNSCRANIGYADAYIENGGLIGDIINSQFRSQISGMVRQMIPGQICNMLPSVINEKLNGKLSGLPQLISVNQMLSFFGGALGISNAFSTGTCSASCGSGSSPLSLASTSSLPTAGGISLQAPAPAPAVGSAPEIPQGAYNAQPQRRKAAARARGVVGYSTLQQPYQLPQLVSATRKVSTSEWNQLRTYRAVPYTTGSTSNMLYVPIPRSKRQAVAQRVYFTQLARAPGNLLNRVVRNHGPYPVAVHSKRASNFQPKFAPPPPVLTAVAPQDPQPVADCAKCPQAAPADDPASFIKQLAANLDMSKLNDIYLSLQLLNTYATNTDFTIDLTGEFSVNGQGGTPFGPFPTQFPSSADNHMAEFILSDYTLNTLFYWLHRKQFLSFRIGPDTPKIGELLKTTCSEDDEELEATDLELDEEEVRRSRRLAHLLRTYRRVKRATDELYAGTNFTTLSMITLKTKRTADGREKRQDDAGGLADLGICFGDILPAVREKYPNQKIAILIHTVRAPSVILSQQRGGMATLDLIADADIFIDGTNTRVGTITIAATVEVVLQIQGNRITGTAQITNLKLTDRTGSLGLPQDALDNLGNLGKELLQKLANDALSKGISVNIPQNLGGLPISIINPTVQIIEHGIYIATDIQVSPSLLGITGGC